MSWTYPSSELDTSTLAQVRLLIGDTDTNDQLLQDEEINFFADRNPSVKMAAAVSADAIAGKFSRQANTSNEGLSVSASQRAAAYRKLAEDLRRDAFVLAEMFVGGRSKAVKEARAEEEDFVQPSFVIGQDDFPGSAKDSASST